jgi:serine/threonine protein kinase
VNAKQNIEQLALDEHWLVGMGDVTVDHNHLIGSGSYGSVFYGNYCGVSVAVKMPKPTDLRGIDVTARNLPALTDEVRVLRQIRHENIVLFYGAFMQAEHSRIALVLEFVNGQRLDTFILRSSDSTCLLCINPPTEDARFTIIYGICVALRYLHSHQPVIMHGDLKPTNIMVETIGPCSHEVSCRAKLLDFGLARGLSHHKRAAGGTHGWCAPELETATPPEASPATDTYSFGKVAYFVSTSRLPTMHPEWPATDIALVCQEGFQKLPP